MWQFVFLSLLAGVAAGALNGFFIAHLRLQPMITTYATSFLFFGIALHILPNPGGGIPKAISAIYRNTTPLGIPLAILHYFPDTDYLVLRSPFALRKVPVCSRRTSLRQLMRPRFR